MPRPALGRSVLLGALALVLALVAGCGTVEAFSDLDAALEDAGFRSTRVNVATGDPVALTVSADAPTGDTLDEAHDAAAAVVWETFPRRFDEARITIDGDQRTVTATQLQEQLGDRPPGLDDQGSLADDVNRVGIGVLLGVLVVGLVVVTGGGLTALLVVRSRRRSQALAPRRGPVPWAPPNVSGPHPGPTPPPGGWGPAAPDPMPPRDPRLPMPPPVAPSSPESPASTDADRSSSSPRPVRHLSHREARADARRRGRPVRGPRPPDSQVPPGWG